MNSEVQPLSTLPVNSGGTYAEHEAPAADLKRWHRELAAALCLLHSKGEVQLNFAGLVAGGAFPFLMLPVIFAGSRPLTAVLMVVSYLLGAGLTRLITRASKKHKHTINEAVLELLNGSGNTVTTSGLPVVSQGLEATAQLLNDKLGWQVPRQMWILVALGLTALAIANPVLKTNFTEAQLNTIMAGVFAVGGLCLGIEGALKAGIKHDYYRRLIDGLSKSLEVAPDEILQTRPQLEERIAKRLRIEDGDGAVLGLSAILILYGVFQPIIWVFMWELPFVLEIWLPLLNIGFAVWCYREASRYRAEVRRTLGDSDLPLRIALGQIEGARIKLPGLFRREDSIEANTATAARQLLKEIGLVPRNLNAGFFLQCYAVLTFAIASTSWYVERYNPEAVWELLFAFLPAIAFPLLALAYRPAIHKEELVRLLKNQMQG